MIASIFAIIIFMFWKGINISSLKIVAIYLILEYGQLYGEYFLYLNINSRNHLTRAAAI
jgi:hypothetical protein